MGVVLRLVGEWGGVAVEGTSPAEFSGFPNQGGWGCDGQWRDGLGALEVRGDGPDRAQSDPLPVRLCIVPGNVGAQLPADLHQLCDAMAMLQKHQQLARLVPLGLARQALVVDAQIETECA